MIDWSQQFLLASINRADLTEFGLSDEQIAAFTDEQMKQIAEKMQTGYYLKKPFWEDFRQAIKEVMIFDVQIVEQGNT